jgi:hypothetical protein
LGDLILTDYPYSVGFGYNLGRPSLDDEPREMSVTVGIEGADLAELADHEAALARECNRTFNEFAVTPGDGFAPTSVFDTTDISATPIRYDDGGEQTNYREWELSIETVPHARSADLTVASPLSVGGSPSVTVFDTCDVATGWSATIDGVSATATTFWEAGSVAIFATGDLDGDEDTVILTRTVAVDFTGTPYLVVEARSGSPVSATADGVALPLLNVRDLGSRHLEYTFLAPTGTVTVLDFAYTRRPGEAWIGLFIYDLTKSNMPPGATAHQLSRIVPVVGTERTPASLQIASSDGTEDLGMTIVHTSPEDSSGYSPPLRRWRVSGGTVTTDASTMSGGREMMTIANPFIAEVPNQALPEGGYLLAARLRVSVAGSAVINWAAETVIDGAGDGYVTDYATVTFPNTGWHFVPVAVLTLPTVRSYSGSVRALMSSATAEIDEGWLFRVDDDCALSVVHNILKPRLWLDSPDLTSRVPRIWVGDDENRLDASHPGGNLYCHGNHTFAPDAMSVFVATATTEYPDITLTHHARWHTNAAS